jgi:hypothetical protein
MMRMNEKENEEEEVVVGNNFLSMFMAVAYCLRAVSPIPGHTHSAW